MSLCLTVVQHLVVASDVIGLEAKILASASTSASRFLHQPGLDLVVFLCSLAFFVQKSCKIREFSNFFRQ